MFGGWKRRPKVWQPVVGVQKKYLPLWMSETFSSPRHLMPHSERRRYRPTKGLTDRADNVRIPVDEPMLWLLREALDREGVGEEKICERLGITRTSLRRIRVNWSIWRWVFVVRQALWLLGYDLEMRIVKLQQPDAELLERKGGYRFTVKKAMKMMYVPTKKKWDKGTMWERVGTGDKNVSGYMRKKIDKLLQ